MIMPSILRSVTSRPENIPGFVFEEVTVKAVGETLDGPLGSVEGGLEIEELHMDRALRARRSGRRTASSSPLEEATSKRSLLASRPTRCPGPFRRSSSRWRAAPTPFSSRPAPGIGTQRETRPARMIGAWKAARSGKVPDRLGPQLRRALEALARGVRTHNAPEARQYDRCRRWSLDLQLQHRPATEVDLARFDLWAAQLLVDAAA